MRVVYYIPIVKITAKYIFELFFKYKKTTFLPSFYQDFYRTIEIFYRIVFYTFYLKLYDCLIATLEIFKFNAAAFNFIITNHTDELSILTSIFHLVA